MKFLILLCNAKSKDDAPKAEVSNTQESLKVEINLDDLNWFQRLVLRLVLKKQFKELVKATQSTDTLYLNKSK